MINLESLGIGFAFGFILFPCMLWFQTNYKPLMKYAEDHPSNTAFLEYLGFMEKKK